MFLPCSVCEALCVLYLTTRQVKCKNWCDVDDDDDNDDEFFGDDVCGSSHAPVLSN